MNGLVLPQVQEWLAKSKRLLIGGRWVEAQSGKRFPTYDPGTGEELARVAEADAPDVDLAVKAARRAMEGSWAKVTPAERARMLWKLGDLIDDHSDEFAQIESLDTGKPIMEAYADVAHAAEHFRYFAGWVTKFTGEVIPVSFPGAYHVYTRREPIGVVGAIAAWNFPLMFASWKLAPALAAGNAVVFKPAEQTPLSQGALLGAFFNQGEVCCAGSRLFVPRAEYDRVLGYIASGQEEGARLLTGGTANPEAGSGYFVNPTVLAGSDAMRVAREEIFGPVLVALPYDTVDEVVRRANDSPYGLAAGIWTRDLKKAIDVAHRLKAGMVWINGYNLLDPASPWGGFKQSGLGREFGRQAMEAFTEVKAVWVNLS